MPTSHTTAAPLTRARTTRLRTAAAGALLAPVLAGTAPVRRAPTANLLGNESLGAGPLGASSVPADPAGAARIRLNQLGFYPAGPKVAVVADPAATRFAVLTADRGDTVLGDAVLGDTVPGDTAFTGTLAPAHRWAPSGEWVRMATFTGLARPGRYVLAVPGVGRSHPFVVGDTVLRALARAAVKTFYFQRASTALPARYAGPWARSAGHPDTAVRVHPSAAGPGRPAGTRLRAPRGWYDAGDYNKYVVNSGISTYTLLALADHFPAYAAALRTNIPESGNALPDVLDEALWNLGWMRVMQDPADGGVYHKLTTAEFSGFVMPAADTAPRYVVQKGTAATLDFAATAAFASRVVRRYPRALPGLADSLAREAAAAWAWARQHPDSAYDQDRLNARTTPRVNTGAYGDRAFADEFRWAAAELYLTTRRDDLRAAAVAAPAPNGPPGAVPNATPDAVPNDVPNAAPDDVPSWGSVGTLGLYSLVDGRHALPAGADTAALAARLLARARALAAAARASAYGVAMDDPGEFGWGSNATAANQGMLLMQAYRLTGDRAFLDAATAALDYLLGRNAVGLSFVTGYGAVTPRHPHHRPSAADTVAAPVPGLLVGGPNPGQQDHCAGYPSRVPALSYVDSTCAYAANEVAINWNAPLAYLAAAVDATYAERTRPARPAPVTRRSTGSRRAGPQRLGRLHRDHIR